MDKFLIEIQLLFYKFNLLSLGNSLQDFRSKYIIKG